MGVEKEAAKGCCWGETRRMVENGGESEPRQVTSGRVGPTEQRRRREGDGSEIYARGCGIYV